MTSPTLTLTHFARRHRHDLKDLLMRNFYVHSHLDWHESDQWLESESAPIRLAWMGNALVGMMAASPPLNGTTWIRLVAIQDHTDVELILTALWNDLRPELRALGASQVAWLMIRDWPIPFATGFGFTYGEQIITLRRGDVRAPDMPTIPDLSIRIARTDELPTLIKVDHAAFVPPWQMSANDIRQAEKVSAITTVATLPTDGGERIVGYQLSTQYFDGAHLARLAVERDYQGRGIGGALVADLLRYFNRKGVYAMTVNTQESNIASQQVYIRYGFQRNGYDIPVYFAAI